MTVRSRRTGGGLPRLIAWCLPLVALTVAGAEHLPIKLYTAADGLASSEVACVVRD